MIKYWLSQLTARELALLILLVLEVGVFFNLKLFGGL